MLAHVGALLTKREEFADDVAVIVAGAEAAGPVLLLPFPNRPPLLEGPPERVTVALTFPLEFPPSNSSSTTKRTPFSLI